MAITFVGSAVGVDTAALPAHQAGDVILVFAYADSSAVVPSLPTGFTSINAPAAGNANGHRLGYRIATSAAETVGTWTNATQLVVAVYRGCDPSSPIGANSNLTGAADVNYPALTLQGASGSWVVGAHGRRTGNQENVSVPTGTVLRGDSGLSTVGRVIVLDTNGPVTSWPQTASGGSNTFRYRAVSVELKPAPAAEKRTGAVNATLRPLIANGAGRVGIRGLVARTLSALTGTGGGKLAVKGAGGGTLAPLTSAASGKLSIVGRTDATLAPLVASTDGRLQVRGATGSTLAPLTVTASGSLPVQGSLQVTLAPLSAVAVGNASTGGAASGGLSAVLAPMTIDARGGVSIQAVSSATLAPLSIVAEGRLTVAGRLAATLGALTAIIRAVVSFPTRTPAGRIVRVKTERRLARVAAELRVVKVAAKETATMSMLTWPFKDPDELLDYQIVWADRLAGDTINASVWTVPAGLSLEREDSDDASATIWLSGGDDGQTYTVLNRITTAAGRVMDQSIRLSVRAK